MKKFYLFLLLCFAKTLSAQTITVQADRYLHVFEGAGISIGLYMGHHWSMNEANREKAIQLVNRDCNMVYLQDYVNVYPTGNEDYYNKRADYIREAKVYQPQGKVSMVGNKFPADLMRDTVIGGIAKTMLRTEDPLIYDKVANWYFQLLKGFKDRGVVVDILNVVNEPDFDKKFYFGQNGNTEKAVGLIFSQAVPKFKEMLNNPTLNTSNIKIPLIMGPSTLDPLQCLYYMRYLKQNYPTGWSQIDIVATHQYNNGMNETALSTIGAEANGKPFFQSEMHTNRGDNLGNLPIDEAHRGALSVAGLFGTAVRNGVSAWFFFENNYPNPYSPAGLLFVAWQSTNPIPYRHYYAFKQITSAQPANSNVMERLISNFPQSDVTVFRKRGEDTIYVHASNFSGNARTININVEGINQTYKIKNYAVRTTDGTRDDVASPTVFFTDAVAQLSQSLTPYSVNTFKIAVQKGTTAVVDKNENNAISIAQFANLINLQTIDNQIIKDVSLHTLTGQIILKQTNLNSEKAEINTHAYPTGVYFLNIKTDKTTVIRKVFVQ
jgi:O-glycosyl hydrolase